MEQGMSNQFSDSLLWIDNPKSISFSGLEYAFNIYNLKMAA